MEDNQTTFKVVLIGSVGTGKTNIASRLIKDEFKENTTATVGVQFMRKMVQVRNRHVKLTLWDTAGQERYKSLSKVYYKGASGVVIVYDVTNPQSFLDVEGWMRLVNENLNLSEIVVMVIGNKVDMTAQRKVPFEKAVKQYKQKLDIECAQVSAKTGFKVEQVFAEMLQKIYDKYMQKQRQNEAAQRLQREQARKEAEKEDVPKITPASIKKQPQIKNKNLTLQNESKKREKASKQKKKGGCC